MNIPLCIEELGFSEGEGNHQDLWTYCEIYCTTTSEMWLCGTKSFRDYTITGATPVPGLPYFSFVAVGTITEWLALNIEKC